jgi:hypothetical protein
MRPPGERDHPARTLDGKGGVYLGHDLFGGVAVVGVVDHPLSENPGPAHDERSRHNIRPAFNVGAFVPIDHDPYHSKDGASMRLGADTAPRKEAMNALSRFVRLVNGQTLTTTQLRELAARGRKRGASE